MVEKYIVHRIVKEISYNYCKINAERVQLGYGENITLKAEILVNQDFEEFFIVKGKIEKLTFALDDLEDLLGEKKEYDFLKGESTMSWKQFPECEIIIEGWEEPDTGKTFNLKILETILLNMLPKIETKKSGPGQIISHKDVDFVAKGIERKLISRLW